MIYLLYNEIFCEAMKNRFAHIVFETPNLGLNKSKDFAKCKELAKRELAKQNLQKQELAKQRTAKNVAGVELGTMVRIAAKWGQPQERSNDM